MKEGPGTVERTPESWEPFMASLTARFRRERRIKRLRRLAALALAAAAAGLAGGMGFVTPDGAGSRLMAKIPASGAPVFDSGDGLVQTLPGGILLINAGGGS